MVTIPSEKDLELQRLAEVVKIETVAAKKKVVQIGQQYDHH